MITKADLKLLVNAALVAGVKVSLKDIQLLTWKKGEKTHKPTKLLDGFFAVYIFKYKKIYLKVGKVSGEKNNDRYYQHHYIVKGANSTLAKSLVNNINFSKDVEASNIRSWIINNTERYNILIPKKFGGGFVNFTEAFFILKCNPLFEGRKK